MSNSFDDHTSWVEINKKALLNNVLIIRQCIDSEVLISASVKANAYGHGSTAVSHILTREKKIWFGVHSLEEATVLRESGIKNPIYIMGYVLNKNLKKVVELDLRLVAYNKETLAALSRHASKLKKKAHVHVKVETGNNRQGVGMNEVVSFIKHARTLRGIHIEGLCTHFANIEDIEAEGQSKYSAFQLENFVRVQNELAKAGIKIPLSHCANSAATLIYPQTHLNMVRPGIALYGLWPSEFVKKSFLKMRPRAKLMPALSWKARIAQIKKVPKGAYIGYGCTYRTKRASTIAIIPIGYYDGYDRGFSNKAYVLIAGKKAPVRGRVCMNIIMVDVTDIPQARLEAVATLLGKDGSAEITAEYLADLIGTINYEITTRIREGIPRIVV